MPSLQETAAAWREWFDAGDLEGGAARVAEVLRATADDPPSVERARVLYAAHLFAFRLGRPSREYAQQALDVARSLGDLRGQSEGLTGLARAALRDGDHAQVAEHAAEGLRAARACGDLAAQRLPLHLYAAGVRLSGDYDRARELYLESLALARALGDRRSEAMEQHNLGWVEIHRGDVEAAAAAFAARDANSVADAYGEAWTELNRAGLAVARGDREEARRLHEEGRRRLEAMGAALDPDDRSEIEWLEAQLRPVGQPPAGPRAEPEGLIARHSDAWAAATRHPFLAGIREGSLPQARFRAWLAADHAFVEDLLRFQARLLACAPRPDQAVLAGGLVALEQELAWFEAGAERMGLTLGGHSHPTVAGYRDHLDRLLSRGYAAALTGLWTLERAYLEAWSAARPGAGDYAEFVDHWTAPEFAGYVDALAAATARAGADEGAFMETAGLEARFWDIGG